MVLSCDGEESEEAEYVDDYRLREHVSRRAKVWEEGEKSGIRQGEAEC